MKTGAVISLDKVDFSSSIDGDTQLLGSDESQLELEVDEPDKLDKEEIKKTEQQEQVTETGAAGSEEEPEKEFEEEEEEEEEGNDEEFGTIEDLATEVGITLPEGKTYETTYEGIRDFFKDMKPIIVEQGAAEFFEELPLAADYARAKASGISDIEWAKQIVAKEVDYSIEELPEDNEALHESIVRNNLKGKGYTPERIERQIKRLKDADELFTEAQDAFTEDKQKELAATEQAKVDAELAKTAKKKAEAEYLKAQEELILKKGKVGNTVIPPADRKAFFEARHAKTEKGSTALEEKIRAMTEEERIALDYYIFKGGNLTKAAEIVAKTQKAQNLLRRAKSSSGSSGMADGKKNKQITGVPKNITNFIPTSDI